MTHRSAAEARAFEERRAIARENSTRRAKAIRDAVADVLDGTISSCAAAAKARNVPVQPVSDLVRAARRGK